MCGDLPCPIQEEFWYFRWSQKYKAFYRTGIFEFAFLKLLFLCHFNVSRAIEICTFRFMGRASHRLWMSLAYKGGNRTVRYQVWLGRSRINPDGTTKHTVYMVILPLFISVIVGLPPVPEHWWGLIFFYFVVICTEKCTEYWDLSLLMIQTR